MKDLIEQLRISIEENGGIFHLTTKESLTDEIKKIIGLNEFMFVSIDDFVDDVLKKFPNKKYFLDELKNEKNLKNMLKEIKVGITGADAIAAESGSVLIADENYLKSLAAFLPETHLVISYSNLIFPTIFDSLDFVLKNLNGKPSTLQIIQGPSKTGDIEKKIVRPSHGPKEFHVIILR